MPAEWAKFKKRSEWHYAEAQRLGRRAFALRCKQTDPHGAQCVKDMKHPGKCETTEGDGK